MAAEPTLKPRDDQYLVTVKGGKGLRCTSEDGLRGGLVCDFEAALLCPLPQKVKVAGRRKDKDNEAIRTGADLDRVIDGHEKIIEGRRGSSLFQHRGGSGTEIAACFRRLAPARGLQPVQGLHEFLAERLLRRN